MSAIFRRFRLIPRRIAATCNGYKFALIDAALHPFIRDWMLNMQYVNANMQNAGMQYVNMQYVINAEIF